MPQIIDLTSCEIIALEQMRDFLIALCEPNATMPCGFACVRERLACVCAAITSDLLTAAAQYVAVSPDCNQPGCRIHPTRSGE